MKAFRFRRYLIVGFILAVFSLLLSCTDNGSRGEILEAHSLFSVGIGVLEDEIDLFHRSGALPNAINRVYMYQGLVFISNAPGKKVMEFTSYGDLISLIYNEAENPRPVLLSPLTGDDKTVNKTFVTYPFIQPGELAVTSDHILLIEDSVPSERQLTEPESGVQLKHVIHRFGPGGEYLDYIGQEGIGGTPFPYVSSLSVTNRDHIVVVTRILDSYYVYWFTAEGDLLYNVKIDSSHLPAGPSGDLAPALSAIQPDMELPKLYLSVNYQTEGNGAVDTRVVTMNLPSGEYVSSFALPDNMRPSPSPDGIEYVQSVYQFIGTAVGEHLMFLGRNNTTEQSLVILDADGKLIADRTLKIDNPDIFLSEYVVSREGIITAMLSDARGVEIYWWRADELIE